MIVPKCREVWLVTFDPTVGHEQAGRRPALVVSRDEFNSSGAELVVVVPITSKGRRLRQRIVIEPPEGGLELKSYIIGEQPRCISLLRLERRLGTVTPATLAKTAEVVRNLLDL